MPTAAKPVTKMTIKREELNPCTIKLDVVCTSEQVQSGFARAYKGFSKQIRIPGFRPGHAPKSVVQKYVPQEDVNGAAAEFIVKAAIGEALTAEEIQPHDAPAVTLTALDEAESKCEFFAKVPLKPVVELGDYKGLPAERTTIEVTDAEVDQRMEELRQRSAKREVVRDRGAMDGDMAVVNIKKDGDEGEGRNILSVIGQNFDALDKALHGMAGEEMKVETLTFPADFQDKDLAGKKAKVRITLKTLASVALPELDDAFAQNLKELKAENLNELKAKLKERLIAAREQASQEMVNEALHEEILRRSTVHVPDTMWESVANQRLGELDQEARRNGKTIEEYAKENGMTLEEMVQNWQHEAKTQVQRAVVAQEIFAKEKMQLTNEDLNTALVQMAYEYQVPPAQIAEIMQKNKNFTELQIRAVFNRVVGFLNDNAEIKEVGSTGGAKKAKAAAKPKDDAPAVKAPAKSTAAKKKS
ncbi:MAG: trigger factor [Chthonomonas sp.]|nr:trigger factor [Chthonomonas sp.]